MSNGKEREQKRLNEVMEMINSEINDLQKEAQKRKEEVIFQRRHFGDEVKVNMDTFDDYLESIIHLRQEASSLTVSERIYKQVSDRLSTLQRMKEKPYFGRIDFKENDMPAAEQVYIGISSLTDPNDEQFLVYDWRAPISSIYYDYEPGPAKYETPGGTIEGRLENKWQFIIKNGILEGMFDTSVTIGDEILQQVLGKSTDKKMQSIVATIQKEQNKVIRHDRGKLLIVHGAAGSGKTSVALQRIAYLLYKYRDNLNAEQIILFSPNKMFSNYVSNVLPELGEENMQQMTFQQYLHKKLHKRFYVEDPYEQIEFVLSEKNSPIYEMRLANIEFKSSLDFFHIIQNYAKSLVTSGMRFKNIKFRGKTILSGREIEEQFYQPFNDLRFHNRLEKIVEWIIKQIDEFQKEEQNEQWVLDEMELLSEEEYRKFHRYLANKKGFKREKISDYELERNDLAYYIVEKKLNPLKRRVKAFQFIHFKKIYEQLFTDNSLVDQLFDDKKPSHWSGICELTIHMLKENKLYYEDATPFLFLQEHILGFEANRSIKHIVVDEGQDYSPFQFEFLKRVYPNAKMTVLGDFNQAIFVHAREKNSFDTLRTLYDTNETEFIQLEKSYRATKPIIEFTRTLIPHGEKIIPFDRDGNKPSLTYANNKDVLHEKIINKIKELQKEGYKSIAVICKSAKESEKAFEILRKNIKMKLITKGSFEYEQGVVVIPSYLAKGIEFDAVNIYDASVDVYDDEGLRKVFYTACTRAMHELYLYSVGKENSFLQNAIQNNFLQIDE